MADTMQVAAQKRTGCTDNREGGNKRKDRKVTCESKACTENGKRGKEGGHLSRGIIQ